MKHPISKKNSHVPLNNLSSVKTASPARGHMGGGGGGGATGGTWSWDPGPPPWVRGSIYKRTVLQDPGPNTHTAATIPKVVLDPLPHPKKRYPGAGGYGGPNPKNHWGVIFGPKMIILQGVKR